MNYLNIKRKIKVSSDLRLLDLVPLHGHPFPRIDFHDDLLAVDIDPEYSIPAVSPDRSLLVREVVKMYSLSLLPSTSVYRFYSSVTEFVVSLPSVHASQQTTLRLTNWLHQLANERLSLPGIFKVSSVSWPMLGAHNIYDTFSKEVY